MLTLKLSNYLKIHYEDLKSHNFNPILFKFSTYSAKQGHKWRNNIRRKHQKRSSTKNADVYPESEVSYSAGLKTDITRFGIFNTTES